MLVTNVVKTVEIPGEDEHVEIRKLSHVQLKLAAKARQSEGVHFMREIGAELMKALRDDDQDKLKRLQDAQEADIHQYDRDTLLRCGVVSWTYPVPPVRPVRAPAVPGVPDLIADAATLNDGLDELDEPTAKFLAEQIFAFSRPETKAEGKNDSSRSTAT